MSATRPGWLACLALLAMSLGQHACARDIKITLPKRSELTPVQRLNREGVAAIRGHQYEKAEALFLKAYLYDPADPFTLNNLGYISELQGKLDRALKFYALAGEQGSDATIDRSSARQLEGKPMDQAFTGLKNLPMRINRMNVLAIEMLSQGRSFEAGLLLQQALALDPHNPFTLNNLGVAAEATGDLETALKDYTAAADIHSSEPIIVTLRDSWRGRPVSQMAGQSARRLKQRIAESDLQQLHARMYTLRGVWAANQNDWPSAKKDFQQAFTLQPQSAFSLNNLAYVSEKDGDLETAQLLYGKARQADDAKQRIGLATNPSAEGKPLLSVAADSNQQVSDEIDRAALALRRQTGPVELIRRDHTRVAPDSKPGPAQPAPQTQPPQ